MTWDRSLLAFLLYSLSETVNRLFLLWIFDLIAKACLFASVPISERKRSPRVMTSTLLNWYLAGFLLCQISALCLLRLLYSRLRQSASAAVLCRPGCGAPHFKYRIFDPIGAFSLAMFMRGTKPYFHRNLSLKVRFRGGHKPAGNVGFERNVDWRNLYLKLEFILKLRLPQAA